MREVWKPIIGHENYEISNKGRVRSIHNGKKRIMKIQNHSHGYNVINLYEHELSRQFSRYIHRLVGQAFIPNPLNKPQINHKDGNKKNNNVSNLEWMTAKENCAHSSKNNLLPKGQNHYYSKLSNKDVKEIKKLIKKGVMGKDIAKKYNVSRSLISKIKLGRGRNDF